MSEVISESEVGRDALTALDDKTPSGFDFAASGLRSFKLHGKSTEAETTALLRELRDQKEATELRPVPNRLRIDENGMFKLGRERVRLTAVAFSDLCHELEIPVQFIRKFASWNSTDAVDMFNQHADRYGAQLAQSRKFVLNTSQDVVYGMVGAETYTLLDNLEVLNAALATMGDNARLTRAYLEGPNLRFTVVNEDKTREVRKGDIVRYGFDLGNSINGRAAVRGAGYAERLVCLNGATMQQGAGAFRLRHQGDVVRDELATNLLKTTKSISLFHDMSIKAASRPMNADEVVVSEKWLADRRNGGSQLLAATAFAHARNEVRRENRDEDQTTLWDVYNGVTFVSHGLSTLARKEHVESVGANFLMRTVPTFIG